MKLGDKSIDMFQEPFIIAEVGANHNGDMVLCEKLVRTAKECGCDAVKFQSWTPDSLISQEEYDRNKSYSDSPKKHFGSLREMVEKYYIREDQLQAMKNLCDDIDILFCSTPFSKKEADYLEELDVPFFKIASMDVNNPLFLRHIARKGRPVVLSTGMSTLSEVAMAVDTLKNEGLKEIVLLHCIAVYPPRMEDVNLNNIPMLKKAFGYPVGFSDHSLGITLPIAATALGTCMIEKHFTLDKDMPGWDHDISADPAEMKEIVNESKKVNMALGSYGRVVSRAEKDKMLKFRRSIVAKTNLEKGHVLEIGDLSFKRPGTGIRPDEVDYVLGRTLKRDIFGDELVLWDAIE